MLKQELKLREAEYFFGEMIKKMKSEQIEIFNYYLSAFLTATRSILQYTHKVAEKSGRIKEYKELVGSKVIRFFIKNRNLNIHTKPVNAAKQYKIFLFDAITVNDSDEESKKDNNKINQPAITLEYRFSYWKGEENAIELSSKYLDELRKFIKNAKRINLIT